MSYFQKLCGIIILIPLLGCNIFKSIDHPSTDAQYRAAAEACMDQGDIQCARDNLSKLSANEQDINLSLTAYTGMMEVGVTPATLMRSLYNTIAKDSSSSNLQNSLSEKDSLFYSLSFSPALTSNSVECQKAREHNYGALITAVAKLIATPTQAQRLTLFNNTVANGFKISSPSLNAYVRFLSLVTFSAQLLAEEQTTPFQLKQSDLVSNPKACIDRIGVDGGLINCENATSIMKTGTQLPSFRTLTAQNFNNPLTMYMIASSVDELNQALEDLNTSGLNAISLKGSLSLLSTKFGPDILTQFGGCLETSDCSPFRAALIDSSIGDCE